MKKTKKLNKKAETALSETRQALIKYYSEFDNTDDVYHIIAYNALRRILLFFGIEESEAVLLLAKRQHKDFLKREIEETPEKFTKEQLELAAEHIKLIETEFNLLGLKEDKETFNC